MNNIKRLYVIVTILLVTFFTAKPSNLKNDLNDSDKSRFISLKIDKKKALSENNLGLNRIQDKMPESKELQVVYNSNNLSSISINLSDSIEKQYNDSNFSLFNEKDSIRKTITTEKKKVKLRSSSIVFKSVNLAPGSLYNSLSKTELRTITDLTITGSIDARDFRIMRDSMFALQAVDLSGVIIKSYVGNLGLSSENRHYSKNCIPDFAFDECYNLISVKIPASVDTIGYYAFGECENLVQFDIPSNSGLRSIMLGAFEYCESLDSIYIPNTVNHIGDECFADCYSLKSIFIPNSVLSIGKYAFADCGANIYVDPKNPAYSSMDGILYNKIKTIIIQCPLYKAGKLTIPSSVNIIGPAAFNHCSNLTEIIMPEYVSVINSESFYGCKGLTSITIPKGVSSIKKHAFYGCKGLKVLNFNAVNCQEMEIRISDPVFYGCDSISVLNIGSLVKIIPANAFNGLSNITSVRIPSSVTTINSYAFKNCYSLNSILVKSKTPLNLNKSYDVFYGVDKSTCTLYVPSGTKSLYEASTQWKDFKNITEFIEQTSKTVSITAGKLYDSLNESEREDLTTLIITGTMDARDFKTMRDELIQLSEIDISNVSIVPYTGDAGTDSSGVVKSYAGNTIPKFAFWNPINNIVHNVTSIKLPSTLEEIGDYAFVGNNNLNVLSIPNAVTRIGKYAFQLCKGLKNVEIPSSVNELGDYSFSGMEFASLTLPSSIDKMGEYVFANNLVLTSAVISSKVVGSAAFTGCINLKSVSFLESLKRIENNAFDSCIGLKELFIPSSVNNIGPYAFSNCISLQTTTIAADTIGLYAFVYCSNMKYANITSDVSLIKRCAFSGCESLDSVSIGAETIGQWAFVGCENLNKIDLSKDVKSILSLAFLRCHSLSNVFIPSTISKIGEAAFGACQGPFVVSEDNMFYSSEKGVLYNKNKSELLQSPYHMRDFTIPSTVKKIGFSAFYGCDSIKTIVLPSNLDSISRGAFYLCTSLDTIVFNKTLKYIGEGAFIYCEDLKNVVIPDGVEKISPGLLKGCTNLEAITIPSSVKVIGYSAFTDCENLNTIYSPVVNPPFFKLIKNREDLYKCFINKQTYENYSSYMESPDYDTSEGYLYELIFDRFDPEEEIIYNSFLPFYGVDKLTCSIVVPQESINLYKAADQWSSFRNIIAIKDISLPYSEKTVYEKGESVLVPVTSNTSWKVNSNVKWMQVSPSSGSGNDTLVVTVDKNQNGNNRSGLLIFNAEGAGSRTITINQVLFMKKQLVIDSPKVALSKIYDGTKTAKIISLGVIQNIDSVYAGNVSINAIADYENSNAGSGKNVIVKYSISGSDSLFYSAPADDTIRGCNIVPKKLTISEPLVQLIKVYDGNTTANILKQGRLSDVLTVDTGNVSVTQTAFYDNSVIGTDKIITVSFDLKGSSCANYLAPDNYYFKGSIISSEVTQDTVLSVSKTDIDFTMKSLTDSVLINSNVSWIAKSDQNWLKVSSDSVTGSITLKISVLNNTSPDSRQGRITISTFNGVLKKIINVTQSGTIKLKISKPTLKSYKTYDGNTSVSDLIIGSLQNVDKANAGNVSVTAFANYEDSKVGNDKRVIVKYELVGSDSPYYLIPENDTITGCSILAKQLTITTPKVKSFKVYDGNTTAVITEPGTIIGVVPIDQGLVNIDQSANYDNAEVGMNKVITVIFSIYGNSSNNYIAPVPCSFFDAVITEAETHDAPIIENLFADSSACSGSDLKIYFKVKEGTPTQYRVDFDASVNSLGLEDIEYSNIQNKNAESISILLPENLPYGKYSGIVQFRDSVGEKSPAYLFDFIVKLPSIYILNKFDDIVVFNNKSGEFSDFQWYKNGLIINGAKQQYYVDPKGLIGTYSVRVKDSKGEFLYTCGKELAIYLSENKSVTVYPNPAKSNKQVMIRINGMDENELKESVINIYDLNGSLLFHLSEVSKDNLFVFSMSDGAYIGNLVTESGRIIPFGIIVNN